MDFKKTEEQELLLESVAEFFKASPYNASYFKDCYMEHRVPWDYFKALYDAGFTTISLPEEYGGAGADTQTLCMVFEALYANGGEAPMYAGIQIDDMIKFGSKEQLEFVSKVTAENGMGCFSLAITEPQGGSDNNNITSMAVKKGDKYIINGHKSMISYAKDYPYMLFICRDSEAPDPKSPFSTFLIPRDTPGIKMADMHKIGSRMGSFCEIYFTDVEVPETALCGKSGQGFVNVMQNFEIERLLVCVGCLGRSQAAYNESVAYAKQREVFGQTIGKYQLIQQKICNMAIKINNMRNYIYQCAWQKGNGESLRTSAALCKLYCSNAGFEVVDDAMQIMGGIGYTEDSPISRQWRDMRMTRLGGGTDEIMVYIAGKQILKTFK